MRQLFDDIDQVLRGGFTQREDLLAGRIRIPARTLVLAGLVLGCFYGACMGIYASTRPLDPSIAQLLATMVKVPLLFLLTLLVTFPSLYVFSALARSPLRLHSTMRLLLAAIAVNLALLASFGLVTAFFTFSTDSYPFMVVLNVFFFGISGIAGLVFLFKAISVLLSPPDAEAAGNVMEPPTSPEASPGEVEIEVPLPKASIPKRVFAAWILIYGVVGAQMGWILRPFIGTPELPFEFFRPRESNFFEAVGLAIAQLFS